MKPTVKDARSPSTGSASPSFSPTARLAVSACFKKLMLRANPRSRSHCRGSLWLPLLRICAFTSLSLCLSPRMLAAAKSSPDFAAAQSPVACELCRVLVLPLVRVPGAVSGAGRASRARLSSHQWRHEHAREARRPCTQAVHRQSRAEQGTEFRIVSHRRSCCRSTL